jgi:cytochrome oxidase assembly protein ShyY1
MLAKESEQHWSPDNDSTRNQWFWKDLEAMKDWVGGEGRGVQAVLVEAIEGESGWYNFDGNT